MGLLSFLSDTNTTSTQKTENTSVTDNSIGSAALGSGLGFDWRNARDIKGNKIFIDGVPADQVANIIEATAAGADRTAALAEMMVTQQNTTTNAALSALTNSNSQVVAGLDSIARNNTGTPTVSSERNSLVMILMVGLVVWITFTARPGRRSRKS